MGSSVDFYACVRLLLNFTARGEKFRQKRPTTKVG